MPGIVSKPHKTPQFGVIWEFATHRYEDVIERLPLFLEEVYNRQWLRSSIGYLPPIEFEATVLNMKPVDFPESNPKFLIRSGDLAGFAEGLLDDGFIIVLHVLTIPSGFVCGVPQKFSRRLWLPS
jgi:hypothetical protein